MHGSFKVVGALILLYTRIRQFCRTRRQRINNNIYKCTRLGGRTECCRQSTLLHMNESRKNDKYASFMWHIFLPFTHGGRTSVDRSRRVFVFTDAQTSSGSMNGPKREHLRKNVIRHSLNTTSTYGHGCCARSFTSRVVTNETHTCALNLYTCITRVQESTHTNKR